MENPFGGRVLKTGTTTSTMDVARNLAASGEPEGFVVLADFQSEGRGRISGRRWVAPPGTSLLVTLALPRARISFPVSLAPALTALALALTVEELSPCRCSLKWPNDLMVGGKKISGILCEAAKGFLYIGMGVNLLQDFPPGDPDHPGRFPASSLKLLTGLEIRPLELLPPLLRHLYTTFDHPGLEWKAEWEKRLYGMGEEITMLLGDPGSGEKQRGRITGLGDAGELLLKTDFGIQALFSAEFSDPSPSFPTES